MTVVAGLADPTTNTVILVADSRVTTKTPPFHHNDVCQKVARLGNEGVFGFAGDVALAGFISVGITGMYKEHGVGWLSSKSEVMGLLSYAAAAGPSGSSRFLEAYIEKGHATLTCFSTEGEYSRITMGIEMIGTGSETYDSIAPRFADILNFAGPGKKGVATAQRALLLSGWIWEASKTRSIESVGGLMQVHFVEKGGIRAIPYRRWVDVGGGYGTYVTMALDAEGAWVQIHGPTGLRVPLRFPGEPDFGEAGGASVNFELERQLDKDSPGVIPTPDIVQAYELFSDETGVIAGVPSGSGVARLQISPETL